MAYEFKVAAINGRGLGPQTDPAIVIIAGTVPSEPLNVRKDSASTTSITIIWDLPSANGFSIITDYEVWWDAGAEDDNFVIIGSSTGNALTFT